MKQTCCNSFIKAFLLAILFHFSNCQDEPIIFHIVCHSHADVGWQLTADQYYEKQVREILNYVAKALRDNTQRKFSWTEIYYFKKWWDEIDDIVKEFIEDVVREGRLEFINGGWVSADEACPTFDQQITNIMAGHSFLMETFGIVPRHAWHPDTFGHSAATADLFVRMGFETITIGRIDDKDKDQRMKNKELEFIWQPQYEGIESSFIEQNGIIVHTMHQLYNAPCYLDMYVFSQQEEQVKQYFESLYSNYERDFDNRLNCLKSYASHYKSNHVLITAGADFSFQFAEYNFNFFQKIKDLIETKTNNQIQFQFSTLDEYFQAMKQDLQTKNLSLPLYHGDFLPYNSDSIDAHYWSGFFTTRPQLKKAIRDLSVINQFSLSLFGLQLLKLKKMQSWELESFQTKHINVVNQMQRLIGKAMHHDTITGTSVREVTDQFSKEISPSIEQSKVLLDEHFRWAIEDEEGLYIGKMDYCYQESMYDNRVICPKNVNLQDQEVFMVVYNPSLQIQDSIVIHHNTNTNIRVKRWDKGIKEFDYENEVETDTICWPDTDHEVDLQCETLIYIKMLPLAYEILAIQSDNKPLNSKYSQEVNFVKDEKKLFQDNQDVGVPLCHPSITIKGPSNNTLELQEECISAINWQLEVLPLTVQFQFTPLQYDPKQFEVGMRLYKVTHTNELKRINLYMRAKSITGIKSQFLRLQYFTFDYKQQILVIISLTSTEEIQYRIQTFGFTERHELYLSINYVTLYYSTIKLYQETQDFGYFQVPINEMIDENIMKVDSLLDSGFMLENINGFENYVFSSSTRNHLQFNVTNQGYVDIRLTEGQRKAGKTQENYDREFKFQQSFKRIKEEAIENMIFKAKREQSYVFISESANYTFKDPYRDFESKPPPGDGPDFQQFLKSRNIFDLKFQDFQDGYFVLMHLTTLFPKHILEVKEIISRICNEPLMTRCGKIYDVKEVWLNGMEFEEVEIPENSDMISAENKPPMNIVAEEEKMKKYFVSHQAYLIETDYILE